MSRSFLTYTLMSSMWRRRLILAPFCSWYIIGLIDYLAEGGLGLCRTAVKTEHLDPALDGDLCNWFVDGL